MDECGSDCTCFTNDSLAVACVHMAVRTMAVALMMYIILPIVRMGLVELY
jgi:hypothetical protein